MCDAIDPIREAVLRTAQGEDPPLLVLLVAAPSLLLLGAGFRVYRTVGAAAAGAAAACAMAVASVGAECHVRLGVVAVGSASAVLLALCLLKRAVFLLGAAGFGIAAHVIAPRFAAPHVDSLLLFSSSSFQQVGGRGLGHWGTVLAAAAVGGGVVASKPSETIVLASSSAGAAGLCLALSLATEATAEALLVVGGTATVAGVGCQLLLRRRIRRRNHHHLSRG